MKKYGLITDYRCIKHFENEFYEHMLLQFYKLETGREIIYQDFKLIEKAINEYKKKGGKRKVDKILGDAKTLFFKKISEEEIKNV